MLTLACCPRLPRRHFDPARLDEELELKRAIRPVTGATLTARATSDAVRRILAIHDVGVHAGTPYIVTELLHGESLRDRVASATQAQARDREIEGRPIRRVGLTDGGSMATRSSQAGQQWVCC